MGKEHGLRLGCVWPRVLCVIPIRPLGSLYIFWVPLPTVFNAVTFPLYAIKTSVPLPPMCPPQIIQQPAWSSNGSIRYV